MAMVATWALLLETLCVSHTALSALLAHSLGRVPETAEQNTEVVGFGRDDVRTRARHWGTQTERRSQPTRHLKHDPWADRDCNLSLPIFAAWLQLVTWGSPAPLCRAFLPALSASPGGSMEMLRRESPNACAIKAQAAEPSQLNSAYTRGCGSSRLAQGTHHALDCPQ